MSITLNASTSSGFVQSADNSGEIELQSNGTTALKVNTNEGIQILNCLGVGNATPSTSGAGITFPATQSASTDANTLDDYEEGSWTPTFEGGTTNPTLTYAAQVARYTKIGNVVTVNGRIRVGAISSAGSGTCFIAGLPFATASTSNLQNAGCIGTAAFWSTTTNGAPDGISADDAVTRMILRVYKNDAGKVSGWSSAEASDLANDCLVDFQMTYRTN
jgi:hypothetical protein